LAAGAAKTNRVVLTLTLSGHLDSAPADAAEWGALPELEARALRRLCELADARSAAVVCHPQLALRRTAHHDALLLVRGGVDGRDVARLTTIPPSHAAELQLQLQQPRGAAVLGAAQRAALLEFTLLQLEQRNACTLVVAAVELRFGPLGRSKAAAFRDRLHQETGVTDELVERALCELPGDYADEPPAELRVPRGCALVELRDQEESDDVKTEATGECNDKVKEDEQEELEPQAGRRALLALLTERWLDASAADYHLVAVDVEMVEAAPTDEARQLAPGTDASSLPGSRGLDAGDRADGGGADGADGGRADGGGGGDDGGIADGLTRSGGNAAGSLWTRPLAWRDGQRTVISTAVDTRYLF
jgi:hypothetical protein